MSLRSEYRSGPDEEEIWDSVLGVEQMPSASDETVAEREEEHIAGEDYQDKQDTFDEQNAPPSNYPASWCQLSDTQREAVQQFIVEILKKSDEGVS